MESVLDATFKDFIIAGIGCFLGTIGGALAANSYSKYLKKEEDLKTSIKIIYFTINFANQTLNSIYSFHQSFINDYNNFHINRNLCIQILNQPKFQYYFNGKFLRRTCTSAIVFELNIYPNLKIDTEKFIDLFQNPTIFSPRDIALVFEICNSIDLLKEAIITRNKLVNEFRSNGIARGVDGATKIYGVKFNNQQDRTFYLTTIAIKTYINDIFFYLHNLTKSLNEINHKLTRELRTDFNESVPTIKSFSIFPLDDLIEKDDKHDEWLKNTNNSQINFKKPFVKNLFFNKY